MSGYEDYSIFKHVRRKLSEKERYQNYEYVF